MSMGPTLGNFNFRMPRKVLEYVRTLDVHEVCLRSGPDKSCHTCMAKIMGAFDKFYGDTPDPQRAMVADLLREQM